ncbi:MAG TPA: endonuclease/exonuclease/phosphatase family protein, partial [Methylomirabilota bacterium]
MSLREVARWCAWLLTVLLVTAAVMTSFGRSCWACELLSHFPAQLAAVALVPCVTFAVVGRRRELVIAAAVAAWNVAALVPFYVRVPTALVPPSDARVIRVVALNVAAENRDRTRVIGFVRATKPDVLVVTELNDFWVRALDAVAEDFPIRRLEPRESHYGIALMSRLPLTVLDDKPAGAHAVVARLPEPRLTIVGTHAFPPLTAQLLVRRNQEFATLAAFVRRQTEPVVLVGDLNSSSWSPAFRDLLRDAGLRDTRLGRGVQSTWPAWLPMVQIPIDHALVSPGVRVHGRFVGERVGSDHLPVVLDFSVEP